jgi:hypothetical protein
MVGVARIRSDFWVSAHLRRCALAGIDAVLRRRGAAEAGAIFVTVDRLDGSVDLYGPAPQSLLEDDVIGRLFAPILTDKAPPDIEARMARELKFDPDLWWLSIDDRAGRHLLDLASDRPL